MKSAKIRITITLVCTLLLELTFVADLLGGIIPVDLVAGAAGVPVISCDHGNYRCTDITQIIADETYLYVMSGHKSILQVYTLEGTYAYTISVCDYSNGRAELALKDDILLFKDKRHNLYLFSDGKFLEYIDQDDPAHIRWAVPFGAYDASYFIKNGSVWKHTGKNESVCIVEAPPVFGFYHNATSWKMKIALVLIIGYTLYLPPIRKKAEP